MCSGTRSEPTPDRRRRTARSTPRGGASSQATVGWHVTREGTGGGGGDASEGNKTHGRIGGRGAGNGEATQRTHRRMNTLESIEAVIVLLRQRGHGSVSEGPKHEESWRRGGLRAAELASAHAEASSNRRVALRGCSGAGTGHSGGQGTQHLGGRQTLGSAGKSTRGREVERRKSGELVRKSSSGRRVISVTRAVEIEVLDTRGCELTRTPRRGDLQRR